MSILDLFKKTNQKRKSNKEIEETVYSYINNHKQLFKDDFLVWTYINQQKRETIFDADDKDLYSFAKYKIRLAEDNLSLFSNIISKLSEDDRTNVNIIMTIGNQEDKIRCIDILTALEGKIQSGYDIIPGEYETINKLANEFDSINKNKSTENAYLAVDEYYKLYRKIYSEHPNITMSNMNKAILNKFYEIYGLKQIVKPIEPRQIVKHETGQAKQNTTSGRNIERITETFIARAKRSMYNLEHVKKKNIEIKSIPIPNVKEGLREMFDDCYEFAIYYPEYIDNNGLRKHLFNDKDRYIISYLARRLNKMYNDKQLKDAIDFTNSFESKEDRRIAHIWMLIDPQGATSVFNTLSKHYKQKANIPEIPRNTVKELWNMYAWAHDHWSRINKKAFGKLIGKPKPRTLNKTLLGAYIVNRYFNLKARYKNKDIYSLFTGTNKRTILINNHPKKAEKNIDFSKTIKPDENEGRWLKNPHITVYYTPIIPRFTAKHRANVKMQGSAIVENPRYKGKNVIGYHPETRRFVWSDTLSTSSSIKPVPKRTVAVDPRYLGYYIYIESTDKDIAGFYECVDTGTAIKSKYNKRHLFVTGDETFDIDIYAGKGKTDNVWKKLNRKIFSARARGDLKTYLFPPGYFRNRKSNKFYTSVSQ